MKLNDFQIFSNLTWGYPLESSAIFTYICTHGIYICVLGLSQEPLSALLIKYCSYRATLQWLHSVKTRLLAGWLAVPEEVDILPSPSPSLHGIAINLS